jgi:hypothetical protein
MRFIGYCILLLCLCFKGVAQQAEWKTDSTQFLMGAPLNATLLVKGIPPHTQVLFPYFEEDSTASIDFISSSNVDSSTSGIQHQMIHFMAFDTGWFTLPNAMLLLQNLKGIDTIYPKPLRIHVFSMPIDTLKSFRINKPILDVPYHWREFLWWIIAILILPLIIILILWGIKRPKASIPSTIITSEETLSAYEHARRSLLLLEKSELLLKDKEKEFQTVLTDIIRIFLAKQYGLATMEATSEEILNSCAKHVGPTELNILRNLFTQADLVKFAKQSLPEETHWDSLRQAFQFIEGFKPNEN